MLEKEIQSLTTQSELDQVKYQKDKSKWVQDETALKLRLSNTQSKVRTHKKAANHWMRKYRNKNRSMTMKVKIRDSSITTLQNLVTSMRTMMQDHASQQSTADKQLVRSKRRLMASTKAKLNAADRAQKSKEMLADWKRRYNSVIDQLAAMSEENVDLKTEVIEWTEVAETMKADYEAAIDDLTPVTIRKVWVKNIGKKGEYTLSYVP